MTSHNPHWHAGEGTCAEATACAGAGLTGYPKRKGLGFSVQGLGAAFVGVLVAISNVPRLSVAYSLHMGGCQNDDPFWGTLDTRCRIIIGNPEP